jgi:predicted nucleic acid-binding protein
VRAVVDPNVLIAALLSRTGAPAQIVSRWLGGEFELVVSEKLLAKLERALATRSCAAGSPTRTPTPSSTFERGARAAPDPTGAPARCSADPGDDYLLALAESQHAVLVSGDQHLLALADELPIQTPRTFLDALAER